VSVFSEEISHKIFCENYFRKITTHYRIALILQPTRVNVGRKNLFGRFSLQKKWDVHVFKSEYPSLICRFFLEIYTFQSVRNVSYRFIVFYLSYKTRDIKEKRVLYTTQEGEFGRYFDKTIRIRETYYGMYITDWNEEISKKKFRIFRLVEPEQNYTTLQKLKQ